MDTRQLADGRFIVSIVVSDDGKHVLEGSWFNQAGVARRFRYGQRVSFSGKPKWFRDHWQMSNPRVQALDGSEPGAATPGILPDELRRRHDWPTAADALRTLHFPPSVQAAAHARRRLVYEEFLLLQ